MKNNSKNLSKLYKIHFFINGRSILFGDKRYRLHFGATKLGLKSLDSSPKKISIAASAYEKYPGIEEKNTKAFDWTFDFNRAIAKKISNFS